jgi:hypothetical protein
MSSDKRSWPQMAAVGGGASAATYLTSASANQQYGPEGFAEAAYRKDDADSGRHSPPSCPTHHNFSQYHEDLRAAGAYNPLRAPPTAPEGIVCMPQHRAGRHIEPGENPNSRAVRHRVDAATACRKSRHNLKRNDGCLDLPALAGARREKWPEPEKLVSNDRLQLDARQPDQEGNDVEDYLEAINKHKAMLSAIRQGERAVAKAKRTDFAENAPVTDMPMFSGTDRRKRGENRGLGPTTSSSVPLGTRTANRRATAKTDTTWDRGLSTQGEDKTGAGRGTTSSNKAALSKTAKPSVSFMKSKEDKGDYNVAAEGARSGKDEPRMRNSKRQVD